MMMNDDDDDEQTTTTLNTITHPLSVRQHNRSAYEWRVANTDDKKYEYTRDMTPKLRAENWKNIWKNI